MTTWASDDLAQVLIAPGREFAGFAQGILREWNSDTFENVVEVRGGRLSNLPVASLLDALTFQAGDVLMLTRWKLRSGRGSAQYWIGMGGKVIFPGTGASQKAVAFLRGELARQISGEVFAERIKSAVSPSTTATSSTSFGDGNNAGPSIPGVEVSEIGRCIVHLTCGIDTLSDTDGTQIGGRMSVEISGATSVAASSLWSMTDSQSVIITGGGSWTHRTGGRFGTTHVFDELNPGTHRFDAKYASQIGGVEVIFAERTIVAISF